jgi:hypothetical protein
VWRTAELHGTSTARVYLLVVVRARVQVRVSEWMCVVIRVQVRVSEWMCVVIRVRESNMDSWAWVQVNVRCWSPRVHLQEHGFAWVAHVEAVATKDSHLSLK